MSFDVVIVGGGPAGLSAALALGRARKRVLVCDSGPRRNAAAQHMHNFVTRDGTPPNEFRHLGREQLIRYPNVEIRDVRVQAISGERGAFSVELTEEVVEARRVILCTGMIDEVLPIEGFRELWGRSIFQCPYCHGWEVKERRWGHWAHSVEELHFTQMLRSWTSEVVVFTNGAFAIPADVEAKLHAAGVQIETRGLLRLDVREGALDGVALEGNARVACEALFVHPKQRQVDLVSALNVGLDADGFVQVDPMTRQTSVPGVYAAGDLTSRMQGAIIAAAMGTQAASMLNYELTLDLVSG